MATGKARVGRNAIAVPPSLAPLGLQGGDRELQRAGAGRAMRHGAAVAIDIEGLAAIARHFAQLGDEVALRGGSWAGS
jgi:hypothetical protein